MILRRLAVFFGPFSLQATVAVAADPEMELASVVESLAGLVVKSRATKMVVQPQCHTRAVTDALHLKLANTRFCAARTRVTSS